MSTLRSLTVVLITSALAACASSGPLQLGPDTYMISKTDKGGIFGNAGQMKADVINEANAFAASKGKVAVVLSTHEEPMLVGRQLASFEYQFRVVSADDRDAVRPNLRKAPDVVIEKTERATVEVKTKDAGAKPDTYTELIKLDDLRKRGIITDAEFEAQKRRLLGAQ